MDAFVSSVASILKDRPHEDPFLIRTLYGIGNGLAEIIKRSLAYLQQVVQHWRDMSLRYSSLRSKHVASFLSCSSCSCLWRYARVSTWLSAGGFRESSGGALRVGLFSKQRQRAVQRRGRPRRSVVNHVSRNVSRSMVTRLCRPNDRARRCLLSSMLLPRSIRSSLRRRGSTRAKRIGDNHNRYCEGRGICMLSNVPKERLKLDLPVGGRLWYYCQKWEKMGASRRVVRWRKFSLPLRFDRLVV